MRTSPAMRAKRSVIEESILDLMSLAMSFKPLATPLSNFSTTPLILFSTAYITISCVDAVSSWEILSKSIVKALSMSFFMRSISFTFTIIVVIVL
jgi:hypothetical protein